MNTQNFYQKTKATIRRFFNAALDALLPPLCPVSGERVMAQGLTAADVWKGFEFIAQPACVHCGEPFAFTLEQGMTCATCLKTPPPFATARSALVYNETARDLILAFKHGDQLHSVHTFLPWLMRAGEEMLTQADLIVPVPLHPWRLFKRRYNQSAIIARALGKKTGLPAQGRALKRVRYTASQGHLKAKERDENVKGAFALNPKVKAHITGKSIVLVDDVYTTGATIRECTKILLENGAQSVHSLTVAKVVLSHR